MTERFLAPLPPDLPELKGESGPLHLLLDGAARGVVDKLYSLKPAPEMIPLFLGTRYAKAINSGPFLLRVEPGSELLQWFLSGDIYTYAGILFIPVLAARELTEALRFYLTATMPGGKRALLRYYDPQIFAELLAGSVSSPLDQISSVFSFFAANAYDADNVNTWFLGNAAPNVQAFSAEKEAALTPGLLEYLQERRERRMIQRHMQGLMSRAGKEPAKIKPAELIAEVKNFNMRMVRPATARYISDADYDQAYARLDDIEERFSILTVEHLFEADSLLEAAPERGAEYAAILSNTSTPMRARLDECAALGEVR